MSSHPESVGEEKGSKYGGKRLQCVVVTPEKTWLDELVDSVVLPIYDGELGVLPGHTPVIARLGFGELRTKVGGARTIDYFVDGGFAQVRDDVVTVLTDRAHPGPCANSMPQRPPKSWSGPRSNEPLPTWNSPTNSARSTAPAA